MMNDEMMISISQAELDSIISMLKENLKTVEELEQDIKMEHSYFVKACDRLNKVYDYLKKQGLTIGEINDIVALDDEKWTEEKQ